MRLISKMSPIPKLAFYSRSKPSPETFTFTEIARGNLRFLSRLQLLSHIPAILRVLVGSSSSGASGSLRNLLLVLLLLLLFSIFLIINLLGAFLERCQRESNFKRDEIMSLLGVLILKLASGTMGSAVKIQ